MIRRAQAEVERLLDTNPAVLPPGPRQVGKTTRARALADARDGIDVDLERPSGTPHRPDVRGADAAATPSDTLGSQTLDVRGMEVSHIHADGHLESHTSAMDRLLAAARLPIEGERDLLGQSRAALVVTAVRGQTARVGHAHSPASATE